MMPSFGVDVRAARTASLLVSLPAVAVSVLRYQRQGAHHDSGLLARLALPIAAGLAVGATVGAALLPFAPGAALKLLLGLILVASAVRLFWKH